MATHGGQAQREFLLNETEERSKFDIGVLRRLRILCISEIGWRDTSTLLEDIKAAGGRSADQYRMRWPPFGNLHPENAAGSSALVEAEANDANVQRFLFDTGWSSDWMDKRFSEEGIDGMLARREIHALVISHEHFDHFWGIGSTLRHHPDIPIYVPEGFRREGFDFIASAGHTGSVEIVSPGTPLNLMPGLAIVSFPMETWSRARGENVVYAQVADKGLSMITGCGHSGVVDLLEYGTRKLVGGETIHAVYGGLHISPFGNWDEKRDATIKSLAGFGVQRLGCNHCTGEMAVRKMLEAGLPVVRGTARHGSKTDLFLGNGDALEIDGS